MSEFAKPTDSDKGGRLRKAMTVTIIIAALIGALWLLVITAQPNLVEPGESLINIGDEKVRVDVSISPTAHYFGDAVTAMVTIIIDTDFVNPDTVVFEQLDIEPYELVEPFEVTETKQDAYLIRTHAAKVRCMGPSCLVAGDMNQEISFPVNVMVSYRYFDEAIQRDRVGYGYDTWNDTFVLGRVDPEGLDSFVFKGNDIPTRETSTYPENIGRLVLVLGVALVAVTLVMLINPRLRIVPKREDSKRVIEQMLEDERKEADRDKILRFVALAKRARETAEDMHWELYEIAEALRGIGESALADKADEYHFGSNESMTVASRNKFLATLGSVFDEEDSRNV